VLRRYSLMVRQSQAVFWRSRPEPLRRILMRATCALAWISVSLHGAAPRYTAEIADFNGGPSVQRVSFVHESGNLLISSAYLWDGKNVVLTGGALLSRSGFGWSSYVCGSWGEGSAYCAVIFANGASYQLPRRSAPGNIVFDFNNRGEFVGFDGSAVPFLWREGTMLELNTLFEGISVRSAPVIHEFRLAYFQERTRCRSRFPLE
jgi:hypothetical protein